MYRLSGKQKYMPRNAANRLIVGNICRIINTWTRQYRQVTGRKVNKMSKEELVKSLEKKIADARKRADVASYNDDPKEYYSLNELINKLENELWRHAA